MTCIHDNRPSRCRMCAQDRLEERYGVPEDHIESSDADEEIED